MKQILVIEPSPFRREETYVRGPYGRLRAWWTARMEVQRHPFAEVRVLPAASTVLIGERILWDGK